MSRTVLSAIRALAPCPEQSSLLPVRKRKFSLPLLSRQSVGHPSALGLKSDPTWHPSLSAFMLAFTRWCASRGHKGRPHAKLGSGRRCSLALDFRFPPFYHSFVCSLPVGTHRGPALHQILLRVRGPPLTLFSPFTFPHLLSTLCSCTFSRPSFVLVFPLYRSRSHIFRSKPADPHFLVSALGMGHSRDHAPFALARAGVLDWPQHACTPSYFDAGEGVGRPWTAQHTRAEFI